MAFMGTSIAAGTGRGVVVGTGMATEIGRIAGLLDRAAPAEDETSLQRRLERVGQGLVWISLAIATGIFFLGLWRGMPALTLFLTSVSLAVAAVPEGLPAVVTIALAVGVRRMARRNALIRRLAAVETLGAADVIATDKTGTLTVGEMTVREAWLPEAPRIVITGEGYAPEGDARLADGSPLAPELAERFVVLARTFAACTNAAVRRGSDRWEVVGDPTEGALLALAGKVTANVSEAARLKEWPFDSDRKRMTVLLQHDDGTVCAYTKGAPDSLLVRCAFVLGAEGVRPMLDADRQAIMEANGHMANRALRVLAAAYREVAIDAGAWEVETIERELVFVGLVGMQDPPRPTAAAAVARCREAGIRVVMITGDHPATAAAIARELGIATAGGRVMTGPELEAIDGASLARLAPELSVYARVSAAHKLQIVRAWQATGATIAMTGDGVNDAPALRGADAGVAMGKAGTEVAKEASAMVITDDDFASIVAAIEEGRGVRANVRKALQYLLAGNAAEVVFIAVCVAAGLPMPLAAIQILWINLVTDGVPALALAIEPPGPGAMARPPGGRDRTLLDRPAVWRIALVAGTTAAVVMTVYGVALAYGGEALARTSAFTVLVYARLLLALGMRSSSRAAWAMSIRSNPVLFAFVAAGLVFQPWSHSQPWAIAFFHVVPMGWALCLALAAAGCIPLGVLEAAKALARRQAAQAHSAS
jgi:Ca2+-transporting ATPase